jgi:two-component system, response regulator PdtaR
VSRRDPRSPTKLIQAQGVHAFIIEDDYLISQTIQDLLGPLGFSRFSFARSEDAAIAGATGEKFDLITADAKLLPGDGVRAVETICATRRIPVVFVTGYPDDVAERLPDRLSHAAVVNKPIEEGKFSRAVQAVLTMHAPR